MFRRSIRNTLVVSALAGAGLVAAAVPSFAATASGPSAQATVTVNQEVSIAITGSQSFALTPGVMDNNATAVTVLSNDSAGYTLTINDTGDPQTGAGASFPSSDLTYALMSGGTSADSCTGIGCPLSTTPQLDLATHAMSNPAGDVYNVNMLATLAPTVAPGSYSTGIVFTVAGK